MNKFLLLTSAALLSTFVGAPATTAANLPSTTGHTSLFFVTTSGPWCNQWNLNWYGRVYYANSQSIDNCGGTSKATGFGTGLKGKVKGFGDVIQLPSDLDALLGYKSFATDFVISAPLRDGGTMIGYETFSGYSMFAFAAGTYSLGKNGNSRPTKFVTRNGRAIPIQMKMFEIAKTHGVKVREPKASGEE